MEIIIEEISRGEKLLSRHKFTGETIKVGRAYFNDIILTDPHICAEHLIIEHNGDHWLINDCDSINGSFLADGKKNANQHIINSGDIICLGKSQIRIVFPQHPVEKTVPFSPFEGMLDFMRNPFVLAFSILLFAAVIGFMFYLNQPSEVNFTQFIVRAVGISLMFALWPFLIALISHLNKHEARVLTQLGVSFAFFNLMWLSDIFEEIVEFNLSSNWPIAWLIALLPIVFAFCLIWLNCYIGFHMSARRRMIIALSITTFLFGGSYVLQLSKQPKFTTRPDYNATIMSPSFRFSSNTTVNEFIADSSKLFKKAEKAAQQKE